MELTYAEHHVYYAQYHLVISPKYRHPVFQNPYRSVLKEIIVKAGYDYDIEVSEIEIPSDHAHMMLSFAPPLSSSDAVRILKSISAREFFKRYPDVQQKYFWGGKLWSPSYYIETIGAKNEAAIRKYIQQQLVHEEKQVAKMKQLKLFS
ncbi:MAG: putative transposase [Parcubacteria group bacterium Gr01-1014_48]|nr:MAG: putative transposase [Parcubacteria group bacterium Gr01-1014_48]